MKTILAVLAAILVIAGCENKAETGALVGAGVGVGAGALIGHSAGAAVIGGAAGAVGGALIGAAIDSSDRSKIQQQSPGTARRIENGEQLSMSDIEKMSRAGISDDKIIGTIQSTGSVYHLSARDVEELQNAGVSQRVIDYMLQTAY